MITSNTLPECKSNIYLEISDLEELVPDGFQPFTDQQQQALREQVRPLAGDGRLEWYKTTQYYDAKTHRLQHGFDPASSGQAGTPVE